MFKKAVHTLYTIYKNFRGLGKRYRPFLQILCVRGIIPQYVQEVMLFSAENVCLSDVYGHAY